MKLFVFQLGIHFRTLFFWYLMKYFSLVFSRMRQNLNSQSAEMSTKTVIGQGHTFYNKLNLTKHAFLLRVGSRFDPNGLGLNLQRHVNLSALNLEQNHTIIPMTITSNSIIWPKPCYTQLTQNWLLKI